MCRIEVTVDVQPMGTTRRTCRTVIFGDICDIPKKWSQHLYMNLWASRRAGHHLGFPLPCTARVHLRLQQTCLGRSQLLQVGTCHPRRPGGPSPVRAHRGHDEPRPHERDPLSSSG